MRECRDCGRSVEAWFHYCPWCAAPQRRKLVAFFRGHPAVEEDGRALRVSRYFGRDDAERHVRFSVWHESGRVEAAVSIDAEEVRELAYFLLAHGQPARRGRLDHVLSRLR
jgi:hypothetical protein